MQQATCTAAELACHCGVGPHTLPREQGHQRCSEGDAGRGAVLGNGACGEGGREGRLSAQREPRWGQRVGRPCRCWQRHARRRAGTGQRAKCSGSNLLARPLQSSSQVHIRWVNARAGCATEPAAGTHQPAGECAHPTCARGRMRRRAGPAPARARAPRTARCGRSPPARPPAGLQAARARQGGGHQGGNQGGGGSGQMQGARRSLCALALLSWATYAQLAWPAQPGCRSASPTGLKAGAQNSDSGQSSGGWPSSMHSKRKPARIAAQPAAHL